VVQLDFILRNNPQNLTANIGNFGGNSVLPVHNKRFFFRNSLCSKEYSWVAENKKLLLEKINIEVPPKFLGEQFDFIRSRSTSKNYLHFINL
jgi:hypothetical protein